MLSAQKVDKLLSKALRHQMRLVGSFTFSEKGFSGGADWDQITLILCCLADISLVLPDKRFNEIKNDISELTEHNWGGVRQAAQEAMRKFSGEPSEASPVLN